MGAFVSLQNLFGQRHLTLRHLIGVCLLFLSQQKWACLNYRVVILVGTFFLWLQIALGVRSISWLRTKCIATFHKSTIPINRVSLVFDHCRITLVFTALLIPYYKVWRFMVHVLPELGVKVLVSHYVQIVLIKLIWSLALHHVHLDNRIGIVFGKLPVEWRFLGFCFKSLLLSVVSSIINFQLVFLWIGLQVTEWILLLHLAVRIHCASVIRHQCLFSWSLLLWRWYEVILTQFDIIIAVHYLAFIGT